MSGRVALVLAGGVGSRLWPLSTPERPKPFRALFEPEPLAAQVIRQAEAWTGDPADVWLSLGEAQLDAAREAVPRLDRCTVLREPRPAGTTVAIARAAIALADARPDAVLLVLAADQRLAPDDAVLRAFERAAALASRGFLVSLGVPPDGPSTAYGYMLLGAPIASVEGAFAGLGFEEKPAAARAAALFAEGRSLWNAGVFAFRARDFLAALARHLPGAVDALRRGEEPSLRAVDHELMERVRPSDPEPHAFLDAGRVFHDRGNLAALAAEAPADARGNRVLGAVEAVRCEGCDLLCEPPRRLRAEALTGLVVAVGAEGHVLVAARDAAPGEPAVRLVPLLPGPEGLRAALDPTVEVRLRGVDRLDVRAEGERLTVRRHSVEPASGVELYACATAEDLAEIAARRMVGILGEALERRGRAVLVPSTGRTVIGCYAALAARHRRALDWTRVEVFQMDEFDGVPEALTARRFLEEHLLGPLGVGRAHLLHGASAAEGDRVERALLAAGADLVVHGLGENGHLGLNEPGTPFDAVAHEVSLAAETRRAKRDQLDGLDLRRGLTLGLGALLGAPRSLLLASGAHKREALGAALFAAPTRAVPASGLQRGGRVTVIADAEALPRSAVSSRPSACRTR